MMRMMHVLLAGIRNIYTLVDMQIPSFSSPNLVGEGRQEVERGRDVGGVGEGERERERERTKERETQRQP